MGCICSRGCKLEIEKCNKCCPSSICGFRCCHCRHSPSVPKVDINEQNIDQLVKVDDYNTWLKQSEIQESRKWFYWLTFHIDFYCWLMIIGNLMGLVVAHIVPVMHYIDPHGVENWTTCHLFSGEPISLAMFIPCVLTFHLVEGTLVVGMLSICIYTLFHWNYSDLALYETLFTLCNIFNLGLMLYEGIVCWISLIRGSPLYQTYGLFFLLIIIVFGVYLGTYIQLNIYFFLRKTETFQIEYPKTENDIISLVRESFIDHGKIRVIGSKHSTPYSIYVDDQKDKNQIMMSLDYYTGYNIFKLSEEEIKENDDGIEYRATVKGGTCLGLNRENPLSKESNGLVYILRDKGFSLADLGGVVQQTVAGFTAMGCAGGTLYHDYYESIHSIRIIDGRGNPQTFTKPKLEDDPNYDNHYWGVIVSMGLMGVISEITFDLRKNYNILGSQMTWPITRTKKTTGWDNKKCVPVEQDGDGTGELNIFANNNDANSIYQLIKNPKNKYKTEYMRIFVWPQINPNIVTVWKGHRERIQHDSKTKEWSECYKLGKFVSVKYHELDKGKKGVAEQHILSLLYNFFDHFTGLNTLELPKWAVKSIDFLIKKFNASPNAMYFGASWADTLPMDQEMHAKLLPFQFTELWIDIEDIDKAMNVLKKYWKQTEDDGLKHAGTFSWEFYPAKCGGYSSKPGGAWIRPAYGRESFRIDVLWFDIKTDIPYNFYTNLWNTLIENNIYFRPHWAKYFPGGNVKFPINHNKYKKWNDYYADLYPKWNQWHDLRNKLDPRNIFLNTYWADSLNIKVKKNDEDLFSSGRTGDVNIPLV